MVAVATLAGCLAVGDPAPDLARRHVAAPERFAAEPPNAEAAGAAEDERADRLLDGWLRTFDDPVLHELVQRAWTGNPDLQQSAAAVDEAFARLRSAAGLLFPQLDAVGSARRFDSGAFQSGIGADPIVTSPVTAWSLGLQVAWEADLWGRLRAGERAALETARATAWDLVQARHSIAAAVAEGYFAIAAARQQLAIDAQLLEAEEFTLRTTSQRVAVGVATTLDENLAAAGVDLARASIQADRQALGEARRALDLLLGRYPDAGVEAAASLPELAPLPAAGLPSQLLQRRPDLLAAEQRVRAAFHDVEAARAALLPSVTLRASGGTLIDPDELFWSIAADLFAPLFAGGRLRAAVQAASAQQRAAIARYVAAALQAFREVEDALAGERWLAAREARLQEAGARLRQASTAAANRYEEGLLTIVDLQQVRRQDFQTRAQLVSVRFERLRLRLSLLLALGGPVDAAADGQPEEAAEAGDHGR